MPGPKPNSTNCLLILHKAARNLLRASYADDQKLVASNLIAALRKYESLWLDRRAVFQKEPVEPQPQLVEPEPFNPDTMYFERIDNYEEYDAVVAAGRDAKLNGLSTDACPYLSMPEQHGHGWRAAWLEGYNSSLD